MTRLDRIIKCFNDYDNLVKYLIKLSDDPTTANTLEQIREEVSLLIGELKRYGCRRKD